MGLGGCECRKARFIRNHITAAFLVWVRLKQVAHETYRTLYQVKHDLFTNCPRQQLRSSVVKMVLV